jgi:hypothetical protein
MYDMDNFYEIATIVLGVWNVVIHLKLQAKRRQTQRLMYSLDKIAHKEWQIVMTKGGFEVTDKDGDTVLGVRDVTK